MDAVEYFIPGHYPLGSSPFVQGIPAKFFLERTSSMALIIGALLRTVVPYYRKLLPLRVFQIIYGHSHILSYGHLRLRARVELLESRAIPRTITSSPPRLIVNIIYNCLMSSFAA